MNLSESTIKTLQQILKEEFGKETTQAEVSEIASALVGYFDTLGKVYGRIENDKHNKTLKIIN